VAFTRWDPFRDLLTLHNELERVATSAGSESLSWTPPVDLYETPSAYVLEAEVPGLTREQIDIHAEEHLIVIRGRRNPRAGGPDTTLAQYHRIERGHGHFSRAFTLPDAIEVTAVSAELRDGILNITLPKTQVPPARRINVT